jgi:CheY-like chemotaxis protein
VRPSLMSEYGNQRPRALVLDDDDTSSRMLRAVLEPRGFDVQNCKNHAEFRKTWAPGFFDVIIADWHLAKDMRGERVLREVRERDWDVPFVLISGRLEEANIRSQVLQELLERGQAMFVRRGAESGADGYTLACDAAEALLERRDASVVRTILSLRPAALRNDELPASSGTVSARAQLEEVVKSSAAALWAARPLAEAIAKRRRGG